jgi:selenocysteine-specific elongation factor
MTLRLQPVTVGVAGHVDHGKTTLVRRLTGISTDRHPEERRRGLTIEAGVAPLALASGRPCALLDVPGHTDYLKNAIRGLHGVDLGLLVVAADDGVMPQTREHLEILRFFGARGGAAVLTKTDLVDAETLILAELEIAELVAGTFLDQKPVLRFSSRQAHPAQSIPRHLDAEAGRTAGRPDDSPFKLWIDGVRHVAGYGTVVSGTVTAGRLQADAPLELLPAGLLTRARSLETHGRPVASAVRGQRVGINLHRVPLEAVKRGMALAEPDGPPAGYLLNISLEVLSQASRPLRDRQRLKVYLGTAVTPALLVLMDGPALHPGESGLAQLRLLQPLPASPREPLVIAPLNQNTVVAGGTVLELAAEKYRRAKHCRTAAYLHALVRRDVDGYLDARLDGQALRPLTARELARDTFIPARLFEAAINSRVHRGELLYFKGQGALRPGHYARLQQTVCGVVGTLVREDPLRPPVPLAEIAHHFPKAVAPALLRHAAEDVCRTGRLVPAGAGYRPPGGPGAQPTAQLRLEADLLAFASRCGLVPFSADSAWRTLRPDPPKKVIRRMLDVLTARRQLARLGDERYQGMAALEAVKARVGQAIAAKGQITLSDSAAILGYGRAGGAYVLDYLDRIGFTERRGNARFLRRPA